MKTFLNFLLCLMLAVSASAFATSATTPILSSGSFSQTYVFTTATPYPSAGTTITLSGSKQSFSSMSFQLLSSTGQALTNPTSLSTFNATRSGSSLSASFIDGSNTNVNLSAGTTYEILVTGVAALSNVQYSLTATNLNTASPFIQVTPAVPEPATFSMLLVGFGLLGCTLRQRQRV